jgi:hypothetical protein
VDLIDKKEQPLIFEPVADPVKRLQNMSHGTAQFEEQLDAVQSKFAQNCVWNDL